MWKSLAVVGGDVVVWLDADVVDFDPAFVAGLVGPIVDDAEVGYVSRLPAGAGRRRGRGRAG